MKNELSYLLVYNLRDENIFIANSRSYLASTFYILLMGFIYQPETFIKVRPRCEAPRRDMIYPMNYTPCRYVRISCLRGNPIAIFFIQVLMRIIEVLSPLCLCF